MKPTRQISLPATYFVTAVTWQRRMLFRTERFAELFIRTLYEYRRQDKFLPHEFVLMPEHFHLLITPAVPLERAMQLIKGGYSYRVKTELGSNVEVWQRGFTDHRVRDAADYERLRTYIHENPVKRGLVMNAAEYRYSSAHAGYEVDTWRAAAEAASLSG
jgi:putative transposase